MRTFKLIAAVSVSLLAGIGTAQAGRGSSLGAVSRAVESGSVDAITSELERAERLYCPACVKIVMPLVDSDDSRLRDIAVWWLSRQGLRSELAILSYERLTRLDSKDAAVAADTLGALRSELAVAPLSAALGNDLYDGVARAAMARALGRIGLPEALPALRRALSAREATVRAAAVEGLRNIEGLSDTAGSQAALPALIDTDATVRAEAAYTVGSLRHRALTGDAATSDRTAAIAVVTQLGKMVTGDASALVRKRAAWALGEIGASASLVAGALEQAAARDTDPLVRSIAGAALGGLSR